ncbi:hypothetical protein ColLi_13486 [Colletotrichum liriopes]|uniref:Uncharacterized protein n=1 Tax=Colletotrichum liriopes TaxID=708192 RepID=A0AA37H0B0_9PEZI|nr:hypothetical protein ColLi_13486 [Colletotrichum liriopes]
MDGRHEEEDDDDRKEQLWQTTVKQTGRTMHWRKGRNAEGTRGRQTPAKKDKWRRRGGRVIGE